MKRLHDDEGMTLPEVIIGVLLFSLIMGAISAAIIVTLRQQDNTTGRLNNARSEQAVGTWMPADLASAETVDTAPNASPCGAVCPPNVSIEGSNALMLQWTTKEPGATSPVNVVTTVSYRYLQSGSEWQLVRVACVSVAGADPSCKANVVLHELDGPPAGVDWVAGATSPTWVIQISQPYDPADTGDPDNTIPLDPSLSTKNAQRIVVTINGGGDAPGAGGGVNQISLSAGGTDRKVISATSLTGTPSFAAARSRCGGTIALIVDESGSIGSSNMTLVKSAISSFVSEFAGTPVKLQIVRFDTRSSVLGASGWSKYYDMLDQDDVTTLSGLITDLRSSGGTNWEDAWFRTFYNSDGTVQATIPDLVVFFTDGVPTYSRRNHSSATAPTDPPAALEGFPYANGSSYNQEAWYRANLIAQRFRSSVRFIGVGVGNGVTDSSDWLDHAAGWHGERGSHPVYEKSSQFNWQRLSNFVLQRSNQFVFQQSSLFSLQQSDQFVFQKSNQVTPQKSNKFTWQRNNRLRYQKKSGSNWVTATRAEYDAGNTNPTESDGFRTNGFSSGSVSWTSISTTQAQYEASNTTADSSDGWRTNMGTGTSTWSTTTQADYDTYNVTDGTDGTDGWRLNVAGGTPVWSTITQAEYEANNSTADASDGWRTTVLTGTPTWTTATQANYDAYNSTPGTDGTDGFRTNVASGTPTWSTNTQANYEAYNTTPGSDGSDGWRTTLLTGTASWSTATATDYATYNTTTGADGKDGTDGWRYSFSGSSWTNDTQANYELLNLTAGTDGTDGWRTNLGTGSASWSTVSQATYDAYNTNTTSSDGWRTSNQYSAPYTQWEYVAYDSDDASKYNDNSDADGWRKAYTAPYDRYDSDAGSSTANSVIITRLIAGNDYGVPGVVANGKYINAEEANIYILPNWSQFAEALEAVALSECGGTLTLQTKVGTTAAADPFTYQNTATFDSSGAAVQSDLTTVTTTKQFVSGTFDFSISDGSFVTVEIQPQNLSDLTGYAPAGWTCRAGLSARTFTSVPIPGTSWTGISVRVAANEAVSCTLAVTRI